MKTIILILLCLPLLAFAQEFQFQQEFDTIPVEIDGWRPYQSWIGGFRWSNLDFCDLVDADNNLDCFVANGSQLMLFQRER